MKKVLVTGGSGYIGSHTVVDLLANGYEVISVDNFSNSNRDAVDRIESITGTRIRNYDLDLRQEDSLSLIAREQPDVEAVIHFAAFKAVGESVEKPYEYYENNILSTLHTLRYAIDNALAGFIYSSSCSVYGTPDELPVTESTPLKPAESPYARTKQIGEDIMRDCLSRSGVTGVSLRYFNPAGAHPSGRMGESPSNPALNPVPVITETAIGLRDEVVVFGDDYPTRDGTCIRDYIHVMDLARAHRLALEACARGDLSGPFEVINMGIGQGVTVSEAIRAFIETTGVNLRYRIGPRRPGDVSAVYSDYNLAREKLGWSPQYTIEDIMQTAWAWEKNRR